MPAARTVIVAKKEGSAVGPEIKEAVVPCAFPREMRDGRCPVAVFNSPASPNERIVGRDSKKHAKPLQFMKGLLALFTERDADIVRRANPAGAYIEANPKLSDEPLICDACFPKSRWYSAEAYRRHTNIAHVN